MDGDSLRLHLSIVARARNLGEKMSETAAQAPESQGAEQESVKPEAPKPEAPKAKKQAPPSKPPAGAIPSGARGDYVNDIQERLGVATTGVMDKPTAAALRDYQRRVGLNMTGRLDVATRRSLGV